jgi:Alpha/beta hydrolase family
LVLFLARSTQFSEAGGSRCPTITTKDGTEIFYKDWGSGQPIVVSHGWPLSSDDWDTQMLFFLNRGFRVIAYDRRCHGRSSQGADGRDMDHYADDLAALTAHLREDASMAREATHNLDGPLKRATMLTTITHDDIRDLLTGFAAAIELDQIRVDALPPEKISPGVQRQHVARLPARSS